MSKFENVTFEAVNRWATSDLTSFAIYLCENCAEPFEEKNVLKKDFKPVCSGFFCIEDADYQIYLGEVTTPQHECDCRCQWCSMCEGDPGEDAVYKYWFHVETEAFDFPVYSHPKCATIENLNSAVPADAKFEDGGSDLADGEKCAFCEAPPVMPRRDCRCGQCKDCNWDEVK
jgi:hypothetical protein